MSFEKEARHELKTLRALRRELVAAFGDKGQLHPLIGGLNPAAQKLYVTQGRIKVLEAQLNEAKSNPRPKAPILTEISVGNARARRGEAGWVYTIQLPEEPWRLANAGWSGHDWYVVENGEVSTFGHRTAKEAAKAWAVIVRGKR